MEKYNYLEAVTNDAKQAILENMDMGEWHNREEYALDWDVCDELENIIAEYMDMER